MKFEITFHLPFKFPVSHPRALASGYIFDDKKYLFRLSFKTSKVQVRYTRRVKKNVSVSVAHVELDMVHIDDASPVTKELLHEVFVRCLEYLNRVIDATKVVTHSSRIHNVSIGDLPEAFEIIVNRRSEYLYSTYFEDPIDRVDELDSDTCAQILGVVNQWETYPDVMLVDKFFEDAKTSLMREQFSSAIIEFQTSFEVFVRNCYRYIMKHLRFPDEQIEKLVSINNLKELMTKRLSDLLDVNLDYKSDGPIKDWNEKLYKLRNDIVHGGRTQVTKQQAYAAQDAYVEARNFIKDAMVAKGFLTPDGKADLTILRRPVHNEELEEKLRKHLVEAGYLPRNKEIRILRPNGSNRQITHSRKD